MVKGQESKVCHLKKTLYGLKQAGQQWHTHLHGMLASLGFQKNISGDVSIFIKWTNGGEPLIILVYLDDIAIFGLLDQIQELKAHIALYYKITDLGEIRQFLGHHIVRNHTKRKITIDQSHYIQHVLTCFDMSQCRPAYTPFAMGTILRANPNEESDSSLTARYQKIIVSLMYATLGS